MFSLPPIRSAQVKIYPENDYSMYFDGCSKGNPGHLGVKNYNLLKFFSKFIFVQKDSNK